MHLNLCINDCITLAAEEGLLSGLILVTKRYRKWLEGNGENCVFKEKTGLVSIRKKAILLLE